jgi:hypothetical protein
VGVAVELCLVSELGPKEHDQAQKFLLLPICGSTSAVGTGKPVGMFVVPVTGGAAGPAAAMQRRCCALHSQLVPWYCLLLLLPL